MKLALALITVATVVAQTPSIPMTGRDVASLVPYENALKPIMQKWSIPGAALAISDQGRLVYARGFGYADKEAQIQVQPGSLFRLASISKTLTGMTIIKLAEEGRLNLDAKFMDLLPGLQPVPTVAFDARMRNITVRMLVQHTGGWERDVPNDASLQFASAAKALGIPYASLTPDLMARWAISQKLDFDPGSKYSYSQAGYLLLGRIIERITGKKYEDAVREKLLTPAGVTTLKLGHALLSQREPDEVKYYDYPGALLQTATPVVPGALPPTPRQYGNFWVEQAEAYGGWIGNTIDLLKYINTLEGRRGAAILNAASLAAIVVRPSITPTGEYVGLTWRIDQLAAGGAHWWHSGGAIGTRNILARRQNNRDWVVLMNSRPQDEETIISEIFTAFAKAETQVTSWPTNDLFSDFGGPALGTSVQTLAFNYVLGGAQPETQAVQVTAAPGVVNFTTSVNAAWLSVDRPSGTTPAAVNVKVNPAELAAGTYQGVLAISAPQSSNGSRAIPVTLTVSAVQGFTSIRNAASLQKVSSAAPASRLFLETPNVALVKFTGSDSVDVAATVVEVKSNGADVLVPDNLALGEATVTATTSAGKSVSERIQIEAVSPGLFTASGDGTGVPLATLLATDADGNATSMPLYDCSSGVCVGAAIDVSTDVKLRFAATGVRSQGSLSVTIGDQIVDILAVDVSAASPGVDLVTVALPPSLAGSGEVDLTLTAGPRISNPVRIVFQ